MTISSSMNAGVMGLAANASKLGTISDNIANASTYGYKRVEADFHSMVISGAGDIYSAGGVRVTTNRLIDERGPLIGTANSTDIAVRGRGMLPVTQETAVSVNNGEFPMMLTTTGSFRTDQDGYLKTETGLVLMGWPAQPDGTIPNFPRDTSDGLEPILINVNQFAGEPTTSMTLGLNLPAVSTKYDGSATSASLTESLPVEYFDNLGTSENLDIMFIPTIPSMPTDPPSNEWTMEIRDSAQAGALVGQYVLTFNDTLTDGGTLASVTNTGPGGNYDPVTGTIQIGRGLNPDPISIDIGLQNNSNGINQLSDAFAPVAISKDGSPVGNMTEVEVDASGYVRALFDIGITRTIYQIPLVDMPNPNGLISLDNQTYQISNESGTYFLWDAGDGPTGDIVSYAREESTVDVANELTELISTQRAYSSNAKVIQTVDEMLQETTNIKR
ncbi:MAG: flagellar hook-basal body complex protein [Pseudomonadota bacterium]